ncbi:putative transcriptional regulator [Acinetobacter phage vB_AbM_WUPSU]|nr:putative transcriptional regulator [Acinetobacter phage vB_AbM_WUPSU]
MKFENLYITCQNLEERSIVMQTAIKMGYSKSFDDGGDFSVVLNELGQFFDLNWHGADKNSAYKKLTYAEFLENYNEAKFVVKIHQAKKELGLSNSGLSLKMGKSRPYIAKMLNQPQSEKVQNKVIAELDKLLNQPEVDDTFAPNLADELESKDKEITDLKKIIESKDLAISGLIKQNDEAKKIHDKDVNALVELEVNLIGAKIDLDRTKVELDYFVNKYKQSEEDVNSLKSKIKRERIIILIVIAILTALFFLKDVVGG